MPLKKWMSGRCGVTDLAFLAVGLGIRVPGRRLVRFWISCRYRHEVPKTANILDALPKRLHRSAKAAIHEIYRAETGIDDFARQFGDKSMAGSPIGRQEPPKSQ